MQKIGTTRGGTVIVELSQGEATFLEQLAREVSSQAPIPVPVPPPPSEAKEGKSLANKPRTKRIKPDQTGSPVKSARLCAVCGKHVGPRKKTCSKVCRLAHNRAAANAAYAKKHPGSRTHARKDAPPPPPARSPDRLDLIRQAADRVNKLREEEAN
jgi:hypothetical protein